jgi:hypothetical protein
MDFLKSKPPASGGEAAPKKRKGGAAHGQDGHEKDLLIMAKAILAASQGMRIMMGIVTIALHLPSDGAISVSMKAAGLAYHTLTVGQKGHGHGIPAWWLFCGLVKGLVDAYVHAEADSADATFSAAVDLLKHYVTQVTDVTTLRGKVLHCGRRSCMKIADTPDLDVVTFAISSDVPGLKDALLLVLERKFGAVILWGPAPPSNLEREVQKIVNKLSSK